MFLHQFIFFIRDSEMVMCESLFSVRSSIRVPAGLEKYGIWMKYFPGLEKYGKRKQSM